MQNYSKEVALAVGSFGAFSVIYGVLVLAWPSITLAALIIILGVYLLTSGVFLTLGSIAKRGGHWVGGAIIGVFSAISGIYIFAHPDIGVLSLLVVISIWSIVTGVMQLAAGFEADPNDRWLIFSGAVQTLFGLYIFANPKGGAIAVIWLIGLTAIVNGSLLTVAALHSGLLRKA